MQQYLQAKTVHTTDVLYKLEKEEGVIITPEKAKNM